ncbi:glycosyltransferase [Polaribacter tangerinus]|uniref:glycosyltransferase n=1 Tax=Polaribacter tangerinus TaxID=1920034 RepID=UPI000B4BA606|nr:glycosyltransferase [Polaribacter tangerinus]
MNNKKNILIISPFFYPEPISTGKFNTDFAIALKNEGHHVNVLCYHPFYPNWVIKKNSKKLKGIKIIRGGKFLWFSKNTFVRRFILELSFMFFIVKNIKKYKNNTDVIIPVFPPSFAFFAIVPFLSKKIKKVGMVHDLQEIYSEDKKGFLYKIIQYFIHKIEKRCYNSCHKLIFLSNEMCSEAKRLYGLKNTIIEVQYPFITLKNSITNDLDAIFNKKNINIVYSGALGEKQNPEKLYNFFLEASSKIENTIFHFFSEGEVFNSLKNSNSNSKIQFHKLVDIKNLEELYQKSDIQIIPQKENTSKGSLPSKLPNLLSSQCKILLITDQGSELEHFFKNNKLEKAVTTWETSVLINSLKHLIDLDVNFGHQKSIAENFFTLDKMISKVLR